jgi:hypothetical protein
MYDCVGRRVASFSVGFGVLGVVLVLLGSIVEVPYTARETFNNYPYNPPGIWADEVLTLRPHTYRYYALDLLNKNNSLIYVKVEKATNPLFFMIKSDYESGFDGKGTIIKKYISAREPPVSPFEYFWTPSGRGAWDFVFDNPYDTTTNVTVKIIDYRLPSPTGHVFCLCGNRDHNCGNSACRIQSLQDQKEITEKALVAGQS